MYHWSQFESGYNQNTLCLPEHSSNKDKKSSKCINEEGIQTNNGNSECFTTSLPNSTIRTSLGSGGDNSERSSSSTISTPPNVYGSPTANSYYNNIAYNGYDYFGIGSSNPYFHCAQVDGFKSSGLINHDVPSDYMNLNNQPLPASMHHYPYAYSAPGNETNTNHMSYNNILKAKHIESTSNPIGNSNATLPTSPYSDSYLKGIQNYPAYQKQFYPNEVDLSLISRTKEVLRDSVSTGTVNNSNMSNPNIKVKLQDAQLWKQFSAIGTEMIITKNGRRMFPPLRINVTGLDPSSKYIIFVDVLPADDCRYKYHNCEWIISGKAEPHLTGRAYLHPDSPLNGSQWMRQVISFHKLKLTNNPMDRQGHIVLNSMHRYIPRIHIVEEGKSLTTFMFNETMFTAVTAYQNERITKLKIEYNPFAKGFRDGQGRKDCRMKRGLNEDENNDQPIYNSSSHLSTYVTD